MGLPWQVAGCNLILRSAFCAAASKRGWPLLRAIRISDMLPSVCTASSSVTVPSSALSYDIGGYCTDGWRNSLGGRMSFGVHSFGVARQAERARAAANIKAMFFMIIFHFEKVQAAFCGLESFQRKHYRHGQPHRNGLAVAGGRLEFGLVETSCCGGIQARMTAAAQNFDI